MVPLLVASRSPWNCLLRSMRPIAGPPPFSSAGCGSILTSKGPVACRDSVAFFDEADSGLVWKLMRWLDWDWSEGVASRSDVRQTAAIRDRDPEARSAAGARLIFQVERGG